MLTRVSIENYRGFKTFRMDGLARVNLLVGKNNSGKTAILEGIQFLTSKGDPAVLAEAAERRGEVVVTQPEQSVSVDIAHFFHGHAIGPDASFSFTGDNGYAPVAVKALVPKEGRVEREDAEARRAPAGLAIKITSQSRPERKEPLFPLSREGGVELELPSRFREFPSGRRSRASQTRFIGPDSLSSRDMAVMWDELTLSGQESDVASALR
ncbi:MAG TPA: AAA family ATPase, partial [Pirellulales bacterium]|nr:AAA family ATPase [Pirellulales bacterium]